MKQDMLSYEFVDVVPDKLEERTVYVAVDIGMVVHKCCCGCGMEVVTPLTPTDWKLTYDGASISLFPSIGNWSFECRSHYWIEKSTVKWASQWSKEQIQAGRKRDHRAKKGYYPTGEVVGVEELNRGKAHTALWSRLLKWFSCR